MPRIKRIIFHQYSPKIKLFLKKNAKFSSAGGSAPRPPCLRQLPTAKQSPLLRISGYASATLCSVYNYMSFRSFCFEQCFRDRSVANRMVLAIDIGVARIFDWGRGPKSKVTCNDVVKFFRRRNFLWGKDIVEWKI